MKHPFRFALIGSALISLVACFQAVPPKTESLDSRRTDCSQLVEHLIDLSYQDYLRESNAVMPRTESTAERNSWKEELDERGMLDRVKYGCLAVWPDTEVHCVFKATTLEEAQACNP